MNRVTGGKSYTYLSLYLNILSPSVLIVRPAIDKSYSKSYTLLKKVKHLCSIIQQLFRN